MKRSILSTVFAIIAISGFTSCATAQASDVDDRFEKETIYTATFQCMSQADAIKEIDAALEADCERYDKNAVLAQPHIIRCDGGIKVRVSYKCVDKAPEVK